MQLDLGVMELGNNAFVCQTSGIAPLALAIVRSQEQDVDKCAFRLSLQIQRLVAACATRTPRPQTETPRLLETVISVGKGGLVASPSRDPEA